MFEMCSIGLELLKFRATSASRKNDQNLKCLVRYRERILHVCERAQPHLRDKTRIQTMRQQLEYYNLRMHKSHFISEIGRPTLKLAPYLSQGHAYDGLVSELQRTCVECLQDTVEAFLGLQNISNFACHSWAAVHRALSSALLLAIIGRQHDCVEVRHLLQELVRVMSRSISGADPSVLVTPITRAVDCLRRLISEEFSTGVGGGVACAAPVRLPDAFLTSMAPAVDMMAPTMGYFGPHVAVSGPEGPQNPYSMVESILYGKT
jgi:hypothetical protein